MAFILDASVVAAWLLPEEYSEAAEGLISAIVEPCLVPSLFWFEIRNILVMCERRGRIAPGGALLAMERVRRLPLDDSGAGSDAAIIFLSAGHMLSAYDAAYLALASGRSAPLATLDRKLALAASKEGVEVLGPFAHGN
jgi:predicted nucleic acid-binding protein